MRQGLLNLESPSRPRPTGPREISTFLTPEDVPRPEATLVLRGRDSADGPEQLLLVEQHTTPGDWVAVRRAEGIRVVPYGDAANSGERLGTVIATLPPGKTLRHVRNLRAFPARRAG